MIVLFTDFGWHDPYVGQMKGRLALAAPNVPVIDLLHAVPDFNAHAGAHLLDALSRVFPVGSVFLCVVDPGVGGPRQAMIVQADGRWYVGPDNGLLTVVATRATNCLYWRIDWRPELLSASFHGRDLFAQVAAEIATTGLPMAKLTQLDEPEARFDAGDLPRILYMDHYGNAWTGLRGSLMAKEDRLEVRGQVLVRRTTFHEAERGAAFWYVNSVGLVEVAVNRGSAVEVLGLKVGDVVRVVPATAGH